MNGSGGRLTRNESKLFAILPLSSSPSTVRLVVAPMLLISDVGRLLPASKESLEEDVPLVGVGLLLLLFIRSAIVEGTKGGQNDTSKTAAQTTAKPQPQKNCGSNVCCC